MDDRFTKEDQFLPGHGSRTVSSGYLNCHHPSIDSSSSSLPPSTNGPKLRHLVKTRPRKKQSRAPTRASILSTGHHLSNYKVDDHQSVYSASITTSNGIRCERLDDGFDLFFQKPVLDIDNKPKVAFKPIKAINNHLERRSEKSTIAPSSLTTSSSSSSVASKSPTKAIQKIIKSFEIRANRESVK